MGELKPYLLDLSSVEIEALLRALEEPPFRARQVYRWIYDGLAASFDEMTDLPRGLRERLAASATLRRLTPVRTQFSADGHTRKTVFSVPNDEARRPKAADAIESVLMRYDPTDETRARRTVCASTQVGCAVGCGFCATGQGGFRRNLSAGEIVEQVLHFARTLRDEGSPPVTNVVFMGMGEPLLNYEATWDAVQTLNSPQGLAMGARHLTISTAGVIPGIQQLAREQLQVGLAISLHAPDDALRNQLVPLNRRYPLRELLAAVRGYVEERGRRVTFEYALIEQVNDWPHQARALAHLLKGLLCHVNLIPLNSTGGSLLPSPARRIQAFQAELDRLGVANTLRVERGVDIQAACGQLRAHSASWQPGEAAWS